MSEEKATELWETGKKIQKVWTMAFVISSICFMFSVINII